MIAEKSKEEQSGANHKLALFEGTVLPHLNPACNLARWIIGNHQDAEDLVQEAYLRALKSFDGFQGGDGRPWLLAIVRNTCYAWLRQNDLNKLTVSFDEEIHGPQWEACDPETLLLLGAQSELIKTALQELALEFREVLILRELEGLSYKEIAAVAGIPIGTVMSRLARARTQLRKCVMRGFSMEVKR
jgi:RNA polymerase sigma-70 factor (ECF subfamily)